jgi:hypothetical protein
MAQSLEHGACQSDWSQKYVMNALARSQNGAERYAKMMPIEPISVWVRRTILAATIGGILVGFAPRCSAQAAGGASGAPGSSITSPITDYFADWFARVTRIQSDQPIWATPLSTVTPRLLEQLRYDQLWQSESHGVAADNFGGGRGLELIPWYNVEVTLGVPSWIAHNGTVQHPTRKNQPPTDGWADETFLLKYRLLSADADHGDYIVTAFMGFSAPTGDDGNSFGHAIFTPTIAFGKGLGNFDFQSTAGIALPNGGLQRLGMPVAYNTAFQYQVANYLWPEIEVNYTWWPNGQREGQSQVFLTSGLVVGTIPIHDRIGIAIGAGYQVAVTRQAAYNHAVLLSARVPF